MEEFRFDPVWRRIPVDQYSRKLEGRFQDRFSRLEQLVNWGALSWLNPHATATKRAHHLGVEHNAGRFLLADSDRTRHRPAFRTAAHILHWGHLPLSYQGSEALLRASHVETKVARVLEHVVDEVVEFGSLECDADDHGSRCAQAMLEGERPFELYRWLSAWIAAEHWGRLWSAICEAEASLGASAPDEDETKQSLARTLVCHQARGFEVLSACNRADYVPRDLLQCGTAWLTIDPDVLWEKDPIGRESADEWALLESARTYLEQRFYATPASMLIHTQAARIIANDLVSRAFGIDDLRELVNTQAGDAFLDKHLRPYHRQNFQRLRRSAPRKFEKEWRQVGVFKSVSLPVGTRFAAEDALTKKSGRARLSYPTSESYSLFAEPSPEPPFATELAGSARRYFDVTVHAYRVGSEAQGARPLLDSLARVFEWVQRDGASNVGDALCSWLLSGNVYQETSEMERVNSEIVGDNQEAFQRLVGTLRRLTSLVEINSHNSVGIQAELMSQGSYGRLLGPSGMFFLRLPWKTWTMKAGREMLGLIRESALSKAVAGSDGRAFELAVAADQLLSTDECSYRFLLLNPTQIGLRRQPLHEWDVIRVDLLNSGRWSISGVECAVRRDSTKDSNAQDLFQVFQDSLRGRHDDLQQFSTWLATAKDGLIDYEDAGRSYTP